jgi:ATP-dependent Clp protease protease subunit
MKVLLLLLLTTAIHAKEITLTKTNTASLNGPVTAGSVSEVMQKLQEVSNEGEASDPIYLVLNTPGGSVMDGLDLIQYMNTLRRPVLVVANFAASMGFHILQHSSVRMVTPFATIMSHRANGSFRGDIPQQVNSRISHITQLVDKMDEHVISRTSGKYNKESYTELIRDEYWSVGDNAIKDGFADEVVTLKCDNSLNGWTDKEISVFIFTIQVKVADCPLITEPIFVAEQEKSEQVLRYFKEIRPLGL